MFLALKLLSRTGKKRHDANKAIISFRSAWIKKCFFLFLKITQFVVCERLCQVAKSPIFFSFFFFHFCADPLDSSNNIQHMRRFLKNTHKNFMQFGRLQILQLTRKKRFAKCKT